MLFIHTATLLFKLQFFFSSQTQAQFSFLFLLTTDDVCRRRKIRFMYALLCTCDLFNLIKFFLALIFKKKLNFRDDVHIQLQ